MKIIQNIGKIQSRKVMAKDIQRVRDSITGMVALCHRPLGFHKDGAFALAHCQVNQEDPLRFFVLANGNTIINPVIHKHLGKTVRHQEGCMSYADTTTLIGIPRYKKIEVSFTGLESPTSEMDEVSHMTISGLLAFIFQHEVDHMNGKHIYS